MFLSFTEQRIMPRKRKAETDVKDVVPTKKVAKGNEKKQIKGKNCVKHKYSFYFHPLNLNSRTSFHVLTLRGHLL